MLKIVEKSENGWKKLGNCFINMMWGLFLYGIDRLSLKIVSGAFVPAIFKNACGKIKGREG